MKSNIKQLAENRNIQTPQALSYELRMSWPTAKQLWDGNISKMRLITMVKVASLFGCRVDDLFEVTSKG